MSYRMWKGHKSADYNTIDRMIGEQIRIGGVDAWLYTYQNPTAIPTDDITKLNTSTELPTLSSIGDVVFGENAYRKYNLEAITIPIVYNILDATPDLKSVGLWFQSSTMDITLHYNTMMQYVGRKIIPGDVLELPNLRDTDVLDRDVGLNKFYVVVDAFRTADGYSATWLHHLYKLKVKPLTDSPEFSDLFDKDKNKMPDNPDDPNNGRGDDDSNSNYDKEMDIMNAILNQADNEMPYIHWTNEHIYSGSSEEQAIIDNFDRIMSGYYYPVPKPDMLFIKLQLPELYEFENYNWTKVPCAVGNVLPKTANDMDFFYLENPVEKSGYTLYQYDESKNKFIMCDIPCSTEYLNQNNSVSFYTYYQLPVLKQYIDGEWVDRDFTNFIGDFTSKDIKGNLSIPHDWRESIPPARGDVPEGIEFPMDPSDGEYFYRTDFTPITLWQFNKSLNKWVQFNYGGRLPWVGANYQLMKYKNSDEKISINDVVKPNTLYRRLK